MTSLEKGQKGESDLFYQFWQDVTRAQARAEEYLVGEVYNAAQFDWKAAMELLQRRHPDRWAKRDMSTIKHEVSGKVSHEHRNVFAQKILDNADLRQQARELLKGTNNIIDADFTEVD
jgi:hypothetical protein